MTLDRLKGAHVLVVEDNMMVAFDLVDALERADANVLGPAARVSEALKLIDGRTPDGAILDVNLMDGVVTPVAEALIERRIPVIVCSGVGLPPELKAQHPELPVYMKPTSPERLAEALARLMEGPGDAEG